MPQIDDIDAYVATLPAELRPVAQQLRTTIAKAAPEATQDVKYGMPTFKIGQTSVIYFAVWKAHVGLYPIYPGTAEFEAKVAPYRARKDTVQFLLKAPIPYDLVAEIVASQLSKLPQQSER